MTGRTMQHVVGISEMYVSTDPADTLVTYSLGSCIGIAAWDPVAKVGGIIHCMLPLSKTDPAKAETVPAMFVDTGVPLFLQALFDRGAQKKRMITKVAGAGQILDEQGMFKIGERNHTVLRKIMWKNEILITAEEVGGSAARTMTLAMADGRVTIKSGGDEHGL